MTKNTYLISAQSLSKLKQRARDIKRSSDLSHTQALDLLAKNMGTGGWKQVSDAAARYRPFENALSGGLIAAYDRSESPDPDRFDRRMHYWPLGLGAGLYQDIINWWADQPADCEDDSECRPNREVLTEQEIHDACRELYGEMQVFIIPSLPSDLSLDKSLEGLIYQSSFFSPCFIWLRGDFHPALV